MSQPETLFASTIFFIGFLLTCFLVVYLSSKMEKQQSKRIMGKEILDRYADMDLLIADGFDDAIIGVDTIGERVVYSVEKCIEILSKDMDVDEAVEYFMFNVECAYMGEKTPIWCWE